MTQMDCRFTTENLADSVWCLRISDGSVVAPVLRLLRNGGIGGHIQSYHRRWILRGNKILFLDADGVWTTIFDQAGESDGGHVALKGYMRGDPNVELTLSQIEMPALTSDELTQPSQSASIFLERLRHPKRDNLVVVCANAKSLHTSWPKDIDDEDRNWDLCVTRYDVDPLATEPPYEYLAHQPRAQKYAAIYNLFDNNSPLWDYKYVWLPDDDLMTSWRSINRTFEVCNRHRLELAQPSLVVNANVNHGITRQDAQYALRFTKFVEIMCPVFSRNALSVCVPTFRRTVSAYGLDHIWPRLLGAVSTEIAIIDSVAVTHTRPLGGNYDIQTAIMEGLQMQRLYAAPANYATIGCVLQSEAELI